MTAIIIDRLPSGKLIVAADTRESYGHRYTDKVNKIKLSTSCPENERRAYALAGDSGVFEYVTRKIDSSSIELNGAVDLDWIMGTTLPAGQDENATQSLPEGEYSILCVRKFKIPTTGNKPSKKYGREVIEVYRGFDKEERIVSKGWVIYTPSELPVVSGCGDDALITAYKTIRLIQENIVKEHQLSPLDDTDIIEMIKNAMEIVSQVSAGCSGDITYEII